MHAYLFGNLFLAIVFSLIFYSRKDLRKVMVFSGLLYAAVLTAAFFSVLLVVSNSDPSRSITPGYWTPPTLFNLGQKTGGYAIEDVMFMFFNGGIAAALYEVVFEQKVGRKINKKLKKGYALLFGVLAAYVVFAFTPLNAIYLLVSFQLFGALALIWQRRDLLRHSVAGGALFLLFYSCLFWIFNLFFPNFIDNYYHLQRTSHIWFLGVPLEEYLYGLSFGMLWAPIYEYEYRLKDQKRKSKQRSSAPRTLLRAAGFARR